MSPTLADRLRTETRALHTAAERSAFMGQLLRGRMERPPYVALLRNLHAVYAALEPALQRHAQNALIAPFVLPGLWRTQAIEHDLYALHGPGWREAIELQAATLAYRQRLVEIDADQPALLLAHAYVRYLGDLSGGQMLRGIVANSLPVPGDGATAFYEFGDAARTRELTQAFRVGLSAITVDATQQDALVDEARLAFQLHQRLFEELALAFGVHASR